MALSVVDQWDGTVNVSISGTGGGAWILKAAKWLGFQSVGPWQTITGGSGNVDLTGITPPGVSGPHFWALVLVGVWSDPVMVSVRPVGQCPWERATRAIALSIEALGLAGVESGSVIVRQIPLRTDQDPLPGVIVSPFPAEVLMGTLNMRDDVEYPVTVGFYDGADGKLAKNLGQWLMWRHRVASLLRESRIETGQTGVYRVVWKPDLPASVAALRADQLVGMMNFGCHSREPRGAI